MCLIGCERTFEHLRNAFSSLWKRARTHTLTLALHKFSAGNFHDDFFVHGFFHLNRSQCQMHIEQNQQFVRATQHTTSCAANWIERDDELAGELSFICAHICGIVLLNGLSSATIWAPYIHHSQNIESKVINRVRDSIFFPQPRWWKRSS